MIVISESHSTPFEQNSAGHRVASRPDEDIAELEELAREIEARRTGVYVINDAEWTELQESCAIRPTARNLSRTKSIDQAKVGAP